jgi:hypothetical protein
MGMFIDVLQDFELDWATSWVLSAIRISIVPFAHSFSRSPFKLFVLSNGHQGLL